MKQATLEDLVTCSKSSSGSIGAKNLKTSNPQDTAFPMAYWGEADLSIPPSIHPSIPPSTHSSFHSSTHASIRACMHLSLQLFIHPSIHPSTLSFKKHLLSAHHMPDTVLALRPQQRTKPAKFQCSGSFHSRE